MAWETETEEFCTERVLQYDTLTSPVPELPGLDLAELVQKESARLREFLPMERLEIPAC